MLEIETERAGEWNGVGEVPAVSRHARTGVRAFSHRHTGVEALRLAQGPGVVEVVFGAGALDAGRPFAVDVDQIVAFAEPAGGGLDDAHHRAGVVAAAFDREHFVRFAGGGPRW